MTKKLTKATTIGLVALLSALLCPRLMAEEFFVQPTGSDLNPGTWERPFATLQRAQQAARKIAGHKPVTVSLRGGTYYLPETLVLTAKDSGTARNPVTYRAYRDEKPIISGGSRLSLKWEPYRDGIWQAKVPFGTTSDQLFVNGELQILARYPNFNPKERIFNGYSADAFSPQRAARWANPKGGFIHAMHSHLWGDYHYEITGKNEKGEVTYVGGWQNNRQMGMHSDFRFVENIFEELDAPGEWFLNTKTSTLYFYPPAGLDLPKATVEIVRLPHLIELRGSQQQPVRFVSFHGLAFRHAARTFMENKEPLLRSDWTTYRGGALFFNGAENCVLENCFLDGLGGNAVFVNNYNRRITVRTCRIEGSGAGGVVFVGDPKAVRSPLFEYNQVQPLSKIDLTPGPQTNNYPANCIVDDCLITRTGRVEKQTAPISIEMSQSITVRHCSIYDVPRAGINIGSGAWGGHIIEGCDVFDTVKETGDHGSFNSWGRDRFWRPNRSETEEWVKEVAALPLLDVTKPIVIHDNRWRCDHGWDIDLDDGSSNYRIYNNLCLNGGLKNREGYHRVVENNIILNHGYDPHAWYQGSQDVFRHNIVGGGYGAAVMSSPPWGQEIDSNLLQQAGLTTPLPASDLQSQSGRDQHSIVADAMFVDPRSGDFRVKPGSPALALGFKNFAMDKFGVQNPALKALTETPFTMTQTALETPSKRDATIRHFLGAQIRDVMGQGEMSAFGTAGETGVLLLEAGPYLGRAGVKKDDVIIALNGQKTDSTADMRRVISSLKIGQEVKIQILHLQKSTPLTLRITEAIPLSVAP